MTAGEVAPCLTERKTLVAVCKEIIVIILMSITCTIFALKRTERVVEVEDDCNFELDRFGLFFLSQ